MIATIDLGGTQTKFGLIRNGKLIASGICSAEPDLPVENHLNAVITHLEVLCRDQGMLLANCEGLGILSTGLVNNKEMRVLTTNGKYDDSKNFDFKAWAKAKTGLELKLENDARGALLGEWHFGSGQTKQNLLMITIGTGIGTAVISEGQLLTGANFAGGNLGGHILVNSGGRQCTCGARGCLEAEASGWALKEIIHQHELFKYSSLRDLTDIGFKEMLEHAEAGDKCAMDVKEHCFKMWGEALVSYIHLFDPERIIIGGAIMNSADEMLESFRKTIARLEWRGGKNVEIVAAQNPTNAGLYGAAALFESEQLENYYPLFFEPVYKPAIWGGKLMKTLDRELPETDTPTGESWEIVDRPDEQSAVVNGVFQGKTLRELIKLDPQGIVGKGHSSEEPFPLLLKIIDAQKDLSLQIHPDEESCKHLEGAEPKTEMWYVLDHAEDAKIMAGIQDGISEEMFRSKVNDPNVRDLMKTYDSTKGQAFFIKATTMHAIGSGNLIYEIQQNSNTTYRVSDWGRVDKHGNPRQLHVEEAMTCMKHKNKENKPTPYSVSDCKYIPQSEKSFFQVRQLASCDFFKVEEFGLMGQLEACADENSFHTLYAVNSDLNIEHKGRSYTLKRGQTCLIPAKAGEYQIKTDSNSKIIRSRIA